jgi:tetratricopeptide (TPR) repeat protein
MGLRLLSRFHEEKGCMGVGGFARVIVYLTTSIVLAISLAVAAESPKERLAYWKENYGELSPAQHPLAKRAHAIFRSVLRAAGMRPGVQPRLLITERDPLGISLPIAIPDGSVILSKRALDLCYRHPKRGDDRLAFMLGHEIAHQLKDDFWHLRFFQAVEASQAGPPDHAAIIWFRKLWQTIIGTQKPPAEDYDIVYAAQELQADEYGIVYAAIAGFNTEAIITEDDTVNFFADWLQALNPASRLELPASSRLGPEQRAKAVKRRLRAILDKVEVFQWGVRFYQVGDYPKAILAFRDFQQSFPSPEVYHNLASSHHQLALKYACLRQDTSQAIPFKLTLAIDPVTRASMISLMQGRRSSVEEHMAEAIASYQRAIALDPSYVYAYSNLGSALLQQGNVYKAIATLQDALAVAPNTPEVQNHLGVALFQAGKVDEAKAQLAKAHALAPTYAAPLFNLGTIVHQEGRAGEANDYWRAYLALDPASPWAEVIRDPQAHASPCGWKDFPPHASESLMGVQVEAREPEIPSTWGQPTEVTYLPLEAEPYKVARYAHGVMTLAHTGEIIMMATLEDFKGTSAEGIARGSTAEHLRKRYGPPNRVLHMTQGASWVYEAHGIAFQLHDDTVMSWLLF